MSTTLDLEQIRTFVLRSRGTLGVKTNGVGKSQVLKFKIKGHRHVYTLCLTQRSKADMIRQSLPSSVSVQDL